MKNLSALFLTALMLICSFTLFAQQEDKRWAISLHGGTAIIQGDGDVGNLIIAGGLGIKYSLANNFGLRFQVFTGTMESTHLGDNNATPPSFPYRTSNTFYEGNIQTLLNIVNFKNPGTGKNVAQLYVGIGVGYTMANLAYSMPSSYPLALPPDEKKTVPSFIIPLSAGLRIYVSKVIDFGLEYSVKGTFTDHLDGFSPSGISNKSNDYYNIPQAYITFNIGRGERNLEWTESTEKLYDELMKAKQEAQDQIAALKKENAKLLVEMKRDVNNQMLDNQRRADSSMKVMQASMRSDGDNDGVSDIFDKEPNSPAGAIVDGGGRTMDVDRDGVPDYLDKCPTVPGKVSNFGCPLQPTRAQLATISDGIKNLQFETGKAVIKPSSFPALDALAQMLAENSSFSFLIEGHTDNVGNSRDNMILSQQRADAVKSYLVSKGVEESHITTKGYGDTRPVVSNDTAAGKAKNRRVDMSIE